VTPEADNLDARLRAHYRRESLDPDMLVRLRSSAGVRPHARRRRLPTAAIVAAAALLLATLGVVLFHQFSASGWRQLAQSAAAEIARNHNKNLAVEFAAQRFRDLDAPMAKLDFTLVPPARMEREGLRLLGARYCHIGSRIAAQIRIADPRDERLTLYEFQPGDDYDGLQETSFDVAGLRVTVWLESGLVMGLARPLR
jgi:hypothetical protein